VQPKNSPLKVSTELLSKHSMGHWLPFFDYPPLKEGYWLPVTSTINWCEEV
jgi:hypothetical protein